MATLPNAPLIEAIFELHWGNQSNDTLTFSTEETSLLPGRFSYAAKAKGFRFHEDVNSGVLPLPRLVKHRFRPAQNEWPCYQIGLGIFTANQINDGYEWSQFKQAIMQGVGVLGESFPNGLATLPPATMLLRYQDGFPLESRDKIGPFLKDKLHLSFKLPRAFLDHEYLRSELTHGDINVELATRFPQDSVIIRVVSATVNAQPGAVFETFVKHDFERGSLVTPSMLDEWLDIAHGLQRHAFDTLIPQEAYDTPKPGAG